MIDTLHFITGNQDKADEYFSILNLKDFRIEITPIDLPEIQSASIEDAGMFKLNAAVSQCQKFSERYLLIDDVSLEFEAMGGFPGLYIKWFLRSVPPEKIYSLLASVSVKAKAICLIGLHDFHTESSHFFKGELCGEIVPCSGVKGFGWDAVFRPENSKLTFAQMDPEIKNKKSHRARAVKKLRKHLIVSVHS